MLFLFKLRDQRKRDVIFLLLVIFMFLPTRLNTVMNTALLSKIFNTFEPFSHPCKLIYLFVDMVAILNPLFLNSYYEMPRGQMHTNLQFLSELCAGLNNKLF